MLPGHYSNKYNNIAIFLETRQKTKIYTSYLNISATKPYKKNNILVGLNINIFKQIVSLERTKITNIVSN